MPYSIISENTEEALYATIVEIEMKSTEIARCEFLKCNFFHINITPDPESIEQCLSSALNKTETDTETIIFLCKDGDVIIQIDLDNKDLKQDIKNAVLNSYTADIEKVFSTDEFFDEYDVLESTAALKLVSLKKQRKATKSVKELKAHLNNSQLLRTLKNTIQMISMQRAFRTKPHILIVEDQAFSHKMLKAALKDYECHICEKAAEAIVKYIELCPDIVLLDIDLPDLSGHELAKLINKIDPSAYVVMITANSYPSDIKTAKENNVKGFIVKPFKKNEIIELIENFKKRRK